MEQSGEQMSSIYGWRATRVIFWIFLAARTQLHTLARRLYGYGCGFPASTVRLYTHRLAYTERSPPIAGFRSIRALEVEA